MIEPEKKKKVILTEIPCTQRDKAFAVYRYPCLGRWRFLHLYITEAPEYPSILARVKAGERLLDVGCCLGHILRQLAADGAPPENLAGLDIQAAFIDLGFELFRDRARWKGRFVVGDLLASASASSSSSSPSASMVDALDGQFGVLHAASFFHLFGWDEQIRIAERLVRFFRADAADALVVGRQVGNREPPTVEAWREEQARGGEGGWKKHYHHNIQTFQALWDEVGRKTGTLWKVTGQLNDESTEKGQRTVMRFAVRRVCT